jgi:2'-5' RNA ligase
VVQALTPLRDEFPGVRWLPPDSLHLTLLFLGDRHPSGVPDIAAAVDAMAAAQAPFEIRTDGGGGRAGPAQRGGIGVAWLNLDRGADEAAALATDLGRRLDTGMAWPEKGHAPHLTVARRAPHSLIARLREPGAVPTVSWLQERVVLFQSDLGSAGPHYQTLHEARLEAPTG